MFFSAKDQILNIMHTRQVGYVPCTGNSILISVLVAWAVFLQH
jgi:hypothetical protein